MKYLFILGRNPELSIEEILSYLEKEDIKVIKEEQIGNSLMIEVKDKLRPIIKNLGGTIAIGEVIGNYKNENPYMGTKNKINYCIWNFSQNNSYNKISQSLKQIFRKEKLKAIEKPLTGKLELQDGKIIKISHGILNEEYFVTNNEFGRIIEKTDSKALELRDMDKPERRQELAISPRLCKIIINLSKVRKNQILLDCFCGVGSILTEALLQGIRVIGVDNDEEAIEDAKKNLDWLNLKGYTLIKNDSRKIKIHHANVIVAEPNLGEILRRSPNPEKANRILINYERLMRETLKNLKSHIDSKIVFTGPYIKLFSKKRIGCNIDNLLENTNLKLIKRFQEFRKDHIIGREIFVLDKAN